MMASKDFTITRVSSATACKVNVLRKHNSTARRGHHTTNPYAAQDYKMHTLLTHFLRILQTFSADRLVAH